MRALVLVILLYSSAVVGDASISNAQKKQELAEAARRAAQSVEEQSNYMVLLKPMPQRMLKASEIEPFVMLGEGWASITEQGVWSVGKRSSLYIRLGGRERPRQLQIQGTYLNGEEPTRLFVNGQLLSDTPLGDHILDLPPNPEDSPYLHIELYHLHPVAPHDIRPESTDTRKQKFRLEQMRVW